MIYLYTTPLTSEALAMMCLNSVRLARQAMQCISNKTIIHPASGRSLSNPAQRHLLTHQRSLKQKDSTRNAKQMPLSCPLPAQPRTSALPWRGLRILTTLELLRVHLSDVWRPRLSSNTGCSTFIVVFNL